MTLLEHKSEVHELRRRLEEAEETLRAIRSGEVDALVVEGTHGEQIFTLQGADHPYRALIEAMQQGAMSLSDDGTVLYCNRCLSQMIGMSHEKVIGITVTELVPAVYRSRFEVLLKQARTGKSQGELEFKTIGDALLPVFVSLAPLPLSGVDALCMVVTDLTEQKKHQNLQETSRRKDEFLAMLAHELRNPLAPIQNAVVILKHIGLADDNLTFARDIIERQVHQLSRLVDDLLDVSRITLGKIKLERQTVELGTMIASAVETSRPAVDSRRQRLTLSLPPKGVRVQVDPTRLIQVIANLLTNAAKYTDEGGDIFLSTEQSKGRVRIRVRDTGIGISAELLPRVFDLFIQGDRSLARSEGGLGIGLTLVRRLVEMQDGTVEASSEGHGKGSEFVVSLPLIPEEALHMVKEPIKPENRNGSPRMVLIVEDNKDGADTLAMLFKMMGHQVRVAYTGADGLRAAETQLPNVVLLDIGLPGMNGYEVAKRLKDLPNSEGTMLIAMTGYGQDEDRQRSREAGFDYHLVKPVDPAQLKRLFESIDEQRLNPSPQ